MLSALDYKLHAVLVADVAALWLARPQWRALGRLPARDRVAALRRAICHLATTWEGSRLALSESAAERVGGVLVAFGLLVAVVGVGMYIGSLFMD